MTNETETLAFDRPESWGMKYYTSLALLTSMGAPVARSKGEVVLGFEGASVPQMSDEQRRIGFDGTKLENVNRTHFFGRLRGSVGLGAGFALDLAYTPPIELGGAKPNIFAAASGAPSSSRARGGSGCAATGRSARSRATSPAAPRRPRRAATPRRTPTSASSPRRTRPGRRRSAASSRSATTRAARVKPYVGVLVTYMDLEFQVNALYGGGQIDDHNLQLTSGTTVAATGGVTYAPSPSWRINVEAFYSWLSIVRPPATSSSNEGFWNARVFVSYRIH